MKRRTLLRRAIVAGGIALAGCTENGSEGETPDSGPATSTATGTEKSTSTETTEPTPTGSPTGTRTSTPTPTEAGTPSPKPDQTVIVGPDEGDQFRFVPESFTVSPGDTVLWVWETAGHNVHPTGQPSGAHWPGKDEEFGYDDGTTYAYTFGVSGTYTYVCEPHQSLGMKGSFNVK